MSWIESISNSLDYIEENLTNDIAINDIANNEFISSYYFQKCFSMLSGYSVGEYIRRRKLSLAGIDVISGNEKIIDIALKYGYDSPDSFTKAFTRFHGSTPTDVRKGGATIKSFSPLHIKLEMEGGISMDYKIVEKEAFKIAGTHKKFDPSTSFTKIPVFWNEVMGSPDNKICGEYGICCDSKDGIDYYIADSFDENKNYSSDIVFETIPASTWAVFPCIGKCPKSIELINKKIYSEWIVTNNDYEIGGKYNVEYYTPVSDYENGLNDNKYYCEVWVQVRKK